MPGEVSREPIDESRLLMLLCELVAAQAVRIERLERRLQREDAAIAAHVVDDARLSSSVDMISRPVAKRAPGVASTTPSASVYPPPAPSPSHPSRNRS